MTGNDGTNAVDLKLGDCLINTPDDNFRETITNNLYGVLSGCRLK